MNCPACGSKATGKVGTEQYYCWDCCVEFRKYKSDYEIYAVAEDGSLMTYDSRDGLV